MVDSRPLVKRNELTIMGRGCSNGMNMMSIKNFAVGSTVFTIERPLFVNAHLRHGFSAAFSARPRDFAGANVQGPGSSMQDFWAEGGTGRFVERCAFHFIFLLSLGPFVTGEMNQSSKVTSLQLLDKKRFLY